MTTDASTRCCARIGVAMPAYARRKGERCGAAMSATHTATIRGKRISLPLCRLHLRVLLESEDPAARARAWAPDRREDAVE
jgi:hypothetical protein